MRRSRPLRADPAKLRDWQDRSRTRLPPISAKRRARAARRRAVVAEVIERDGGCVAVLLVPEVACWGPLDPDEVQARGRGGDDLDPTNIQALCRSHHRWKHENPKAAEFLGLSKPSWEDK